MRSGTFEAGRRPAGVSMFIISLVLSIIVLVPACGNDNHDEMGTSSPAVSDVSHENTREQEEQVWTCSMHPDIKLKEPGKCPICFMDLIPLETGDQGESLDPGQLRMTESAAALASVETAPVRRGEASTRLRLFGTVDLDETGVTRITARIAGRLDALYVDYAGAFVSKGDRLAEIYSPELIGAQQELIVAARAAGKAGGSGSSALDQSARRMLQAARDKLLLYGLSNGQVEQIEKEGKVKDHLVIYSPVTGTVVAMDAIEGMYVGTGTPVYTVADLSTVWVSFRAYQSDLVWLRQGQKVRFEAEAFPSEGFEGDIVFIDPVLDRKTRTAGVRVVADNPDGRLRPDMFVSGVVQARMSSGAENPDEGGDEEVPLLIPATAPLLTGERSVVYVRLPGSGDPVFEGREVLLGPLAGEDYVVLSGVDEGEEVVIGGAFKIDSELQIRARPSMMSMTMEKKKAETRDGHLHDGHPTGPGSAMPAGLTPVYEAYFIIQMALAGDDQPAAKKAVPEIVSAVRDVDAGSLEGDLADRWKRLSEGLAESARGIEKAEDISGSRKEFDLLSKLMIEIHSLFGHGGNEPYFLTYCPMANSNEGAFWLQNVDTVYNSHYGAMMLRCGEIRERLDPSGNGR